MPQEQAPVHEALPHPPLKTSLNRKQRKQPHVLRQVRRLSSLLFLAQLLDKDTSVRTAPAQCRPRPPREQPCRSRRGLESTPGKEPLELHLRPRNQSSLGDRLLLWLSRRLPIRQLSARLLRLHLLLKRRAAQERCGRGFETYSSLEQNHHLGVTLILSVECRHYWHEIELGVWLFWALAYHNRCFYRHLKCWFPVNQIQGKKQQLHPLPVQGTEAFNRYTLRQETDLPGSNQGL